MINLKKILVVTVTLAAIKGETLPGKGSIMASDFIEKYGYPSETHKVRTKDDYTLTVFRIPHGKNSTNHDRPVVLLQHGILLDADSWILRGPREDLAFKLADAGYDVWLGNARGSAYSKHSVYTNRDPEFWNYGVTETGMYDLSAMIDYALTVTGKTNLTFIGHSRGNSMLVILLSTQPEYNAKVNLYIGLAPVIYSKYARTLLFRPASTGRYSISSSSAVAEVLKALGVNSIFRTTPGLRQVMSAACNPLSVLNSFCSSAMFLVNGEDFANYNKSLTPLIIKRFALGVGSKEYVHILQMRESDEFAQFDYGTQENMRIYGQPNPPLFDINQVTSPAYLFYGSNDLFVSERDLFKYALQLPNLKGITRTPKFNHIDYMFAKNAQILLYPQILKIINEYHGCQFSFDRKANVVIGNRSTKIVSPK